MRKRLGKRRKIYGFLTLILVAGAVALAFRFLGPGGRESDSQQVRSYVVTRKDIAHKLNLSGRIVPVSSTVITPRQSGRIVELKVKEGSKVRAGDVLLSMRLEAQGQTDLLASRADVR